MEPDKYQQAWKSKAAQPRVFIDTDLLLQEMQRTHRSFQATVFWQDIWDLGFGPLLIPLWIYMGVANALPWTWYLEVPAALFVAGFMLVDRRRHPQKRSELGTSLLHCAKESLVQVEHQIWLQRNIFWWNLLPYVIATMGFFVHVCWQVSSSLSGFLVSAGALGLLTFIIYGMTYFISQRAVRLEHEPRRQDLLNLVASLEGETNDKDSNEVIKIVSKLAGRPSTWKSWANNWNQTVPSWRVAIAVIAPTLAGALCGLYSGLWIRIPEMGPAFFQTVVGAVIPFEVAFFSFMYLAARKKKQNLSASVGGEQCPPTTVDLLERAGVQDPMRLPRAPALMILVLTVIIGIMAILALITFPLSFYATPWISK